jgi:CRISPR-associated endonuclease/helicase Cas3
VERLWAEAQAQGLLEHSPLEDRDLALPPDGQGLDLLIRFCFSALVDADCLDTARHFDGAKALASPPQGIADLSERFAREHQRLSGEPSTPLARARARMHQDCLDAASRPIGMYRLSMPTGGGKTLSGMAFALEHARVHGLERVVVAVPYTSITEQTAGVYRRFLGEGCVLEHHSGFDPDERGLDEEGKIFQRTTAVSWDAPVIVTTTVRLFEALAGNRVGASRRLHRLSRCVLILDEAQSLPLGVLEPAVDLLRQLPERYGTTVVLSTATQPAFEALPGAFSADEIVSDPAERFSELRRVRYDWEEDELGWDEVASRAQESPQALVIVNTRADATALLDEMPVGARHLSTSLCPQHRREVLASVRQDLTAGRPCLLVSTQVVEAGVDIDFPLVLRAIGPLDSIIQAAGRCNREGRLDEGEVVVFRPREGSVPPGAYSQATTLSSGKRYYGKDLNDPLVVSDYFRELYTVVGRGALDRNDVQNMRRALDFPGVAQGLRLIEDDTETVVVQYGDEERQDAVRAGCESLRAVRKPAAARAIQRSLAPCGVSMARWACEKTTREGLLQPLCPGWHMWLGEYDLRKGLVMPGSGPGDPLIF